MGNDGGSIPKRRELVKEAARNPTTTEIRESIQEQQQHLWNFDPLSQLPLSSPVVSDFLGHLFNKESILEYLLSPGDGDSTKRAEQDQFLDGAVTGFKDVVEVKFSIEETKDNPSRGLWICPITRQELGPSTKAVYLVPCGHAFSAAAVKEISDEQCPECNETYAKNDVIPILPTSENDISRLRLRRTTLTHKGLYHSLKKINGASKKRKKATATEFEFNGAVEKPNKVPKQSEALASVKEKSTPDSEHANTHVSAGIKNATTASLAAKVLHEQNNKKQKLGSNENIQSLFSSRSSTPSKGKDIEFMNRGFIISSK